MGNEDAEHRKFLIGFIVTSLVLQTLSGILSIVQTAATTYFKESWKFICRLNLVSKTGRVI